jgi:hypothetical protein
MATFGQKRSEQAAHRTGTNNSDFHNISPLSEGPNKNKSYIREILKWAGRLESWDAGTL